ncbi:MAG: energy-coupling factor ABC transporter substrate-binding protein [Methanomicrobiales archaeon]
MAYMYMLELLSGIVSVAFCAMFLYTGATIRGAEFAVSDTIGSELIAKISGTPVENFQPLIPQWVLQSGDIEACLFALHAAVGGILVGDVFEYWFCQTHGKAAG